MIRKLIYIIAVLLPVSAAAQLTLTLERTIALANDSSLQAFRVKNLYLSDYWAYRSYKAERLPSLSLDLTPVSYYRYITQRYDSQEDIDVYRPQQNYTASGGLNLTQNFDPLGGTFYVETGLQFMRNFGNYTSNQYSSVPVRVGYRQSLLGYNSFRWDRKIEPLKFEKAKNELAYNMQEVAESAVDYFFTLALAQAEYRLAQENLASSDTLYVIGERRFKIMEISEADLLTLKLDKVNARNTLENARITLKRAMFSLASFLGLDKNMEINVKLPSAPLVQSITVDRALAEARANNPTLMSKRESILEAKRTLNKTIVESRLSASLNASIGFNQVATTFGDAYADPMRQDVVSLTLSIPLVDWGVRKGKVNMARNSLNIAEIAARQEELSLEEDVVMTVNDFNI